MKYRFILPFFLLALILGCHSPEGETTKTDQGAEGMGQPEKPEYTLVIHGGAGYAQPDWLGEEGIKEYKKALSDALDLGENILKEGGSSMDAVETVIAFLEDVPLFNAGKGAVFTNGGKNELDASFMDGETMNAGAVGGVTTVKNPIKAARAVMEKSKHVMLTGKGAETFAEEQGLDLVENKYFFTQDNYNRLQEILKREKQGSLQLDRDFPDRKHGTVGCVALDKKGNLAAGTSTGGMTNKKYGRIGDSPIIGAGTYADNNTCAVSCTGHGEFFIRYAVAHDLSARMKFGKISLEKAADEIINK